MSTLLTNRMKTARKDYLGDNCKLFFPWDEGSGTQFTDLAYGIVVSDSGAGFTKPHAITLENTGETTPVKGTVPHVPKGKSAIMMGCHITNLGDAFNTLAVGDTTTANMVLSASFGITVEGVNKGASFAAGVNGQTHFRCGTWNGKTGELRSYSGINGGGVAFQNTADGSALVGDLKFSNTVVIGANTTFVADYYFWSLLVVDALPDESDLIAYCDWTYQQVLVGHKVIHPDFAKY